MGNPGINPATPESNRNGRGPGTISHGRGCFGFHEGAIADLTPMLVTNQHADVYNLMGFSLRKTGDYKQAYTFYKKALDSDPQHKGALEYLGELYVETGQVEKAKENVALLQKICPAGCEELEDLQEAIAQAPKTN